MSVRRFLAYFLAVTAGSTTAFASFLIAPGVATSETSSQEVALETSSTTEMDRIFQAIEERQRHKAALKRPQIVLAEYRMSN